MSDITNSTVSFSEDDVSEAVAKLVKAGKSVSRAVEDLLVMAVWDSIVNRKADVANALTGALRTSMKRDGVIGFLEHFGQLYDKKGKNGFVHFALGKQEHLVWSKEYVALVKEEAQNWEAFKPAAKATGPLDMVKVLEKAIKQFTKAQDDGEEIVDAKLGEYMKALLGQYSAAKLVANAQETARQAGSMVVGDSVSTAAASTAVVVVQDVAPKAGTKELVKA